MGRLNVRGLEGILLGLKFRSAVHCKGIAIQDRRGAAFLGNPVLYGDLVAHIQSDHFPVLGGGEGIKYLFPFQTEEELRQAVENLMDNKNS